jgi:hypothetical protein
MPDVDGFSKQIGYQMMSRPIVGNLSTPFNTKRAAPMQRTPMRRGVVAGASIPRQPDPRHRHQPRPLPGELRARLPLREPGEAKIRYDIPDERIGFIIFAHVMLIGGALALLFMAMR